MNHSKLRLAYTIFGLSLCTVSFTLFIITLHTGFALIAALGYLAGSVLNFFSQDEKNPVPQPTNDTEANRRLSELASRVDALAMKVGMRG